VVLAHEKMAASARSGEDIMSHTEAQRHREGR
jgi:hypothetical protein